VVRKATFQECAIKNKFLNAYTAWGNTIVPSVPINYAINAIRKAISNRFNIYLN
jgi:hypothetical protein